MSEKIYWLRYILNFLEDPNHPSVGPHLKQLHCTGLWRSNVKSNVEKFKQFLFYVTIIFFCTQYIKCCINFNVDSLKLILQYTPFHIGIIKACCFKVQFENWQKIVDYISSIERSQLNKKDKIIEKIINGYINRNRRVSYFFWSLGFFANFSIFSEPYKKNQIKTNGANTYFYMFDGYTPFNREPPGYYLAMCIQTFLGYIVSAYVVGWDTLVVSIMIFFSGQLRISRVYCSQVIDIKNPIKSHKNIVNCHRFHVTLVRYQKLFNSLISRIMFVYLIVISVNLGVCIIQIVEVQDDLAAVVSSCLYMVACLIQLLLFYWYGNDVIVESTFASYSTFESNWPNSNKKLQKEIALLALTTKKRLVFKAGPFNEMSLPTFIAILRASYSFYTLMNTTSNN